MAEIKAGVNLLFLRDEELRTGMELLFYAYREFTSEADAILEGVGMGRAHHRVIYFVGRHPGITVSQLMATLRITKQSLSRVLGDLIKSGHVEQTAGVQDRRQRLLRLTDKGQTLERRLTAAQRRRFAQAYRTAGAEAVQGFRKVMLGLLDEPERALFGGTTGEAGDRRE